jgi:glycosyltransferase involved in cell wall biosynthesis
VNAIDSLSPNVTICDAPCRCESEDCGQRSTAFVGKTRLVGVLSAHRNVGPAFRFAQVSGFKHIDDRIYPQFAHCLRRFFPGVAKGLKAIGVARNSARADLLHSRQTILLNPTPWVVSYDCLLPHWPRPYFSDRAYSAATSVLAWDECRAILPYSMHAKQLLLSRNQNHPALDQISRKISVVSPAVPDCGGGDLESIPASHDDCVEILFVGTQFFIKGGHLLIDVFSRLRKQFQIRLTVVSSMSTVDWTTHRPRELATEYTDRMRQEGVTYYSELPNEAVRELMKSSHIFVMPSIDETFGLVLVEAASAGCAVISSSTRAIPEIVNHGETGLLVEHEVDGEGLMVRDGEHEHRLREGLERHLRTLLEDPVRLMRMRQAARAEYLRRFTIERLSDQIGEVYRRAVS